MVEHAFFIVPIHDLLVGERLEELDRAARLDRLNMRFADLGALIRARIPDLEMEFLEGLGGWTVRTNLPLDRSEITRKLDGLPVEVAPDERFYAAPGCEERGGKDG